MAAASDEEQRRLVSSHVPVAANGEARDSVFNKFMWDLRMPQIALHQS